MNKAHSEYWNAGKWKYWNAGKWLFAMRPARSEKTGVVYIRAENGEMWAYGPRPSAAVAALKLGTSPEHTYAYCCYNMYLFADVVYEIRGDELHSVTRWPRDGGGSPSPSAFAFRETADVACAAAGWPRPLKVFPTEENA